MTVADRERAVITGNRYEAWLSPTRLMAEIQDRKGAGHTALSMLNRADVKSLKEIAETAQKIQEGKQSGRFSEGRFNVRVMPYAGSAQIEDTRYKSALSWLTQEDMKELEELADTLKDMMEEATEEAFPPPEEEEE